MRSLVTIGLLMALSAFGTARATVITIDPASYADNTDLTGLFDTVELSTAQGFVDVIGTDVLVPLQLTSDTTEAVFAKNGLFANSTDTGLIWSATGGSFDDVLRADFLVPVISVSMLFLPNDIDTGFLQIYDRHDNLIDETIFRGSDPFTLTLSDPSIAYALATYGDTGRLGALSYAVPEPTTLSLLGAGLLAIGLSRRRRVSASTA